MREGYFTSFARHADAEKIQTPAGNWRNSPAMLLIEQPDLVPFPGMD
jgi:hypothetical protein